MHSKKNKPSILYLLSYYNIIFMKNPVLLLLLSNSVHTNNFDLNFVNGVPGNEITIFQLPF